MYENSPGASRPLVTPDAPRGLRVAVVLAALLALGLPSRMATARVAADKRLHFGVSVGLGAGANVASSLLLEDRLLRVLIAVPAALLPGVAKEIHDASQPGNRFSAADLAWDLLGASAGAVVASTIELLLSSARQLARPGPHFPDRLIRLSIEPGRCTLGLRFALR